MNPLAGRAMRLYRGTRAELALEPAVAALGVPYRFQFPTYVFAGGLRYFPDFVLPTLGLVIEVDDDSHDQKRAEDAERTAALEEAFGWRVVRCTNDEAVRDPVGTVNRLMERAGVPNRVSPGLVLPTGRWLPALAGETPRRRTSRARPGVLPDRG